MDLNKFLCMVGACMLQMGISGNQVEEPDG